MHRLFYILFLFSFLACEKKRIPSENEAQEEKKQYRTNNILSRSCINETAQNVDEIRLRLVTDVSDTKKFGDQLKIKNIDYAPGCGYLSLEADLNENIDYYHWRLCDEDESKCLDGNLGWTPQVIDHIETENDTDVLNLDIRACVNNDQNRIGKKQRECLSQLSQGEDEKSCLCSEKVITEQVVQLSNVSCTKELKDYILEYIHVTRVEIPELTKKFRNFIKEKIEIYESFSPEEKEENLAFLPFYKAIKNLISMYSDEKLADYYSVHYKGLADFQETLQGETQLQLAGSVSDALCPFEDENIRLKFSQKDHGVNTKEIVQNVSATYADKQDSTDDLINGKRFAEGADPNVDTSFTGSSTPSNPNDINDKKLHHSKTPPLLLAGIPLITFGMFGVGYTSYKLFSGSIPDIEDWNMNVTQTQEKLDIYMKQSADNLKLKEDYRKFLLADLKEFETHGRSFTKKQFEKSRLADLQITVRNTEGVADLDTKIKTDFKNFRPDELKMNTGKKTVVLGSFMMAAILATGIALMIEGAKEYENLTTDFTKDFLESLSVYEERIEDAIIRKDYLMEQVFSQP